MNTKDFRAAIVAVIQTWGAASFPAVPLIHENGPVPDQDKIGPIWIDVEFRWYGAQPRAFGDPVSGRHSGAISVSVFYRGAQGTSLPDDIIESATTLLKTRRFGSAVVKFPSRTVPTNLLGWYKTGLLFPFTLDV